LVPSNASISSLQITGMVRVEGTLQVARRTTLYFYVGILTSILVVVTQNVNVKSYCLHMSKQLLANSCYVERKSQSYKQ